MIRQLLILVVILLAFSCSKGEKSNGLADKSKDTSITLYTDKVASNHKASDTIFIHREITKDYYHAIYVDTTRQSKYYERLTDFGFNKYDKESYESTYKYIKDKSPNIYKRKNLTNIPEKWIPVYQYKSKYYIYAPSDWGSTGRLMINDSSFVLWYMDGPYPVPIQSIKRSGSNKYNLEINTIVDENLSTEKLIIHVIDKKTELSIFEFSDQPEEYRYELYIPIKSAKYFDMVVNYSAPGMAFEF